MLKLEANNQILNFDVELLQKKQKIGIAFSGGLDSSLMFCLLCKYAPGITIIPFYGIPFHQLPRLKYVRDVYKRILKKYPNVDIQPMRYFGIDKKEPYWINKSKGIKIKMFIQTAYEKEIIETGVVNLITGGTLSNPPRQVCKDLGFYHLCEERRWFNKKEIPSPFSYSWKPMKLVNKKWVAGMFEKEGLMDWLYLYCNSCGGPGRKGAGQQIETKNWTIPCKDCFNCYETHWAFGTYDYGII
tara:strand:- start:48 stop:776 length:729 start_codon:yes stop_codon:yes gene_type:complete